MELVILPHYQSSGQGLKAAISHVLFADTAHPNLPYGALTSKVVDIHLGKDSGHSSY
jgi:hypothetical protein